MIILEDLLALERQIGVIEGVALMVGGDAESVLMTSLEVITPIIQKLEVESRGKST